MAKSEGTELFSEPKRENAVDLVISRIKQALADKRLRSGDKLPTEKELAEGLGVGRGSVREAIKILAALGVVTTQHGDGTYIRPDVSGSVLGPLLFSLIISGPEAKKLIEFREMLEFGIVRLLVRGIGESRLAGVVSAFRALEELALNENPSASELTEADLAFHRALGEATGNEPAAKVYSFILEYFRPFMERLHANPEYRGASMQLHEALFRAVTDKDLGTAEKALEAFDLEWEKLF